MTRTWMQRPSPALPRSTLVVPGPGLSRRRPADLSESRSPGPRESPEPREAPEALAATRGHRPDRIRFGADPPVPLVPELLGAGVAGIGRPLPGGLRRDMERGFGEGFRQVRLVAGAHVRRLGARAVARGREVHVAPEYFDLGSRHGRSLIGHELAHVVQQRRGEVRLPEGAAGGAVHDPALEAEAEAAGESWLRDEAPEAAGGVGERQPSALTREPAGAEQRVGGAATAAPVRPEPSASAPGPAPIQGLGEGFKRWLREKRDSAGEKLGQAKDWTVGKLRGARDWIGGKLGGARDWIGGKLGEARDRLSETRVGRAVGMRRPSRMQGFGSDSLEITSLVGNSGGADREPAHDAPPPPPEATLSGVRQRDTSYISRGHDLVNVNPEHDKPLRQQIARANSYLDVPESESSGKPVEDLSDQLALIAHYGKSQIGYDKEARGTHYVDKGLGMKQANLGPMLSCGEAACREKSIFAHLLLAERGVASTMESGTRERSEGGRSGHAWLRLPDGSVLDATSGKVISEEKFAKKGYGGVKVHPRLVEPERAVSAADLEKATGRASRTLSSRRAKYASRREALIRSAEDRLAPSEPSDLELSSEHGGASSSLLAPISSSLLAPTTATTSARGTGGSSLLDDRSPETAALLGAEDEEIPSLV